MKPRGVKVKEVKGLLVEKKSYGNRDHWIPNREIDMFNEAIDQQSEREFFLDREATAIELFKGHFNHIGKFYAGNHTFFELNDNDKRIYLAQADALNAKLKDLLICPTDKERKNK